MPFAVVGAIMFLGVPFNFWLIPADTGEYIINVSTVKPVLRGHDLWEIEKTAWYTGDLLKEAQFLWNFSMAGDLLIQVTA